MSSSKRITLRAFEIQNTSVTKAYSDLHERLCMKLKNSNSVNDRRMELNKADDTNHEQDLISHYATSSLEQPIFCTLLRASIDNNVQHINAKLFKKKSFTLDEMTSTNFGNGVAYKRHFYFSVFKNHLVTNLPGNITIRGLQTYLSWYLEELYEINPKINDEKISELSNIEHIKVKEPEPVSPNEQQDSREREVSSITTSLKKISKTVVKRFLQDSPDLDEERLNQIVSAELVLKFRKPRKNDSDALKKAYSALLKPVADIESYQIKRRNLSPIISGKDILESRSVSVEMLEKNIINEQNLEQEMRKYIFELEARG